MKRIIQHQLSEEDRKRHRLIREQIEAEKDQLIAEDRLVRQLWALADQAKAVIECVDEGELPSSEQVESLRDAVEKALASRCERTAS
jgi:hypothetical protein